MNEFLQSYGDWIVVAIFFVVMLRLHAGHGGHCGAGDHDHVSNDRSLHDQDSASTSDHHEHLRVSTGHSLPVVETQGDEGPEAGGVA